MTEVRIIDVLLYISIIRTNDNNSVVTATRLFGLLALSLVNIKNRLIRLQSPQTSCLKIHKALDYRYSM